MAKTKFSRTSRKGHKTKKSRYNKSKKNRSKKGGDIAGFTARMLGNCDTLRKSRIENGLKLYYNNLGKQQVGKSMEDKKTDSLKGIPKIPNCDGTYEDFDPDKHTDPTKMTNPEEKMLLV